jgi:hypothetical protein
MSEYPDVQENFKRTSESDIVEVNRGLDHLELAANIVFIDTFAEVGYRRVCWIVGTEDFDSFIDLVRFIDIIHYQKDQHESGLNA